MLKRKGFILSSIVIGCAMLIMPIQAMASVVTENAQVVNHDFKTSLNGSVLNDFNTSNTNISRQTIVVDNQQMSYIQLGNQQSKKSIVIIHGSAFNTNIMLPYGQLYANAGYNVVLVDLPGHYAGNSSSTDEFNQLSNSVSSLMKKLIKEKKLNEKSEVHGWSLGGAVALDIGTKHPEMVKSVGMIDSASNFNGIILPSVTDQTELATLSAIVQQIKSPAVSQNVTDKIIAGLPYTEAPAEAVNNDFTIDRLLNIDDDLSKITVPVYVFYGSDDSLVAFDKQKEMMSKFKHSKLYIADGYNHFAVVENPTLVYNAINSMKEAK